jgi:putative membrane protein
MNARRLLFIILLGFYLLLWIGGVVAYITAGAPPEDARWTAPLFLLLAGALVLVTSSQPVMLRLLLAGLIGMLSEFTGVHLGIPFGEYRYTDALQPVVLGVPIAMTAAWLVLVAYVRVMLDRFTLPRVLDIVIAAAWMTTIDLIIDPLAAGPLGYWKWVNVGVYYGIPATNFLGWFIVSLIVFAVIGREWSRNVWAGHIGLSIIIFFTVLAVSKGLMIPAMVGTGLVVVHMALRKEGTRIGADEADGLRSVPR